jgi:hypothetical protein
MSHLLRSQKLRHIGLPLNLVLNIMTINHPQSVDIESAGYEAGLNPMFGEWEMTFTLSPITREATNEARRAFRKALLEQLNAAFLFSSEVSLSLTLYLFEHKVLEEAKYGDLDNHMKPILDAMKGPDGLLIGSTYAGILDRCRCR